MFFTPGVCLQGEGLHPRGVASKWGGVCIQGVCLGGCIQTEGPNPGGLHLGGRGLYPGRSACRGGGGVCIQEVGWADPSRTRKADSTQPTGMLSCFTFFDKALTREISREIGKSIQIRPNVGIFFSLNGSYNYVASELHQIRESTIRSFIAKLDKLYS